MAGFADDFDDKSEGDYSSQPLPPEDRLWRHPSELGGLGAALPLDPLTVRRRWLASQPSKASAWTAGLVGALLATGLVAFGTHLAGAITNRAPSVTPLADSLSGGQRLSGIGTGLAAGIATIGRAVVAIDVTHGTSALRCLGVGVRADGLLLAPAADLAGASSIMVMLADGSYYVGSVVASDASVRAASSGLALVHIKGVTDLPVARFDSLRTLPAGTTGVALNSAGGASFALGTLQGAGSAAVAGSAVLVDAITTDIATADAPAGSVLLGANGKVLGIVTGASAGRVVATPGWIASIVASKLASAGAVTHGWLGIAGATTVARPKGVLVADVATRGPAAEAGMRDGDVIVSVDGARVTTMASLQGRLYFAEPGTKVSIGIVRAGRRRELHAVLDDHLR